MVEDQGNRQANCIAGKQPLEDVHITAGRPTAAIVILNWNGRDDTVECLESLRVLDYPRERVGIIVLDNASTDGSREAIGAALEGMREDGWRELTLTAFDSNLGFGRAYNMVADTVTADYDYVYCSNNDIAVLPNTLTPLIEIADADETTGIVGPRVMSYDRPTEVAHGAGFVRPLLCRPYFKDTAEPSECDFVTGCALLIRSSAIQRLETLFDPGFFAYWEDTDLCARVKALDMRVVYCPKAEVLHKVSGATSSQGGADMDPARTYYKIHGKLLYATKHLPPLQKALFLALFVVRVPAFAMLAMARSQEKAWPLVRAYLKACLHGIMRLPGREFAPIEKAGR